MLTTPNQITLSEVDVTLGPEDELFYAHVESDPEWKASFERAQEATVKQGGFIAPDYSLLVDVTDCPDCESKVYVGGLEIQCGFYANSASVHLVVISRVVVAGRNLWTFVARANA